MIMIIIGRRLAATTAADHGFVKSVINLNGKTPLFSYFMMAWSCFARIAITGR